MKAFYLFLLLGLTCLTTAQARLVELPEHGFSIEIPEDWKLSQKQGKEGKFFMLTVLNPEKNFKLELTAIPMSDPGKNRAIYYMLRGGSQARLRKRAGLTEPPKFVQIHLGNLSGIMTSALVGTDIESTHIAASKKYVYSLHFTVEEDADIEKSTGLAAEILNSFKATAAPRNYPPLPE